MAFGLQQSWCLTAFAIVCLASSLAAFECINCQEGVSSGNPKIPMCSDVNSPFYKVPCNDTMACVKSVITPLSSDIDVVTRECNDLSETFSKEKWEDLIKKNECVTGEHPMIGKVTICACRGNLCNSATSQHLNNLMKILITLFLLVNLRRIF